MRGPTMSDHREAIAEVIHEGGWQIGANRREEWRWCKALPRERSAAYAKADALLGSDVLAQIRAEAQAEALLPIRRYAEAQAVSARARGIEGRDWLDLLALLDRAALTSEGSA